jgi:hypothetical protein
MGNAQGPSGTGCRAIRLEPIRARRPRCARPCDQKRPWARHHAERPQGPDPGLIPSVGRGSLRPAIFDCGFADRPRHLFPAMKAEFGPMARLVVGGGSVQNMLRDPNRLRDHRMREGARATGQMAGLLDSNRKLQFFPIVNATRSSRGVQMRAARGPRRRSVGQLRKVAASAHFSHLMAGS